MVTQSGSTTGVNRTEGLQVLDRTASQAERSMTIALVITGVVGRAAGDARLACPQRSPVSGRYAGAGTRADLGLDVRRGTSRPIGRTSGDYLAPATQVR